MNAGMVVFTPGWFWDVVLPAALPARALAGLAGLWGRFCTACAAGFGETPRPPAPLSPARSVLRVGREVVAAGLVVMMLWANAEQFFPKFKPCRQPEVKTQTFDCDLPSLCCGVPSCGADTCQIRCSSCFERPPLLAVLLPHRRWALLQSKKKACLSWTHSELRALAAPQGKALVFGRMAAEPQGKAAPLHPRLDSQWIAGAFDSCSKRYRLPW